MKTFEMIRQKDESGISGVGLVLVGVVFPNGVTVVQWCSRSGVTSLGVYDTFDSFKFVHIDSHPTNDTIINWKE